MEEYVEALAREAEFYAAEQVDERSTCEPGILFQDPCSFLVLIIL